MLKILIVVIDYLIHYCSLNLVTKMATAEIRCSFHETKVVPLFRSLDQVTPALSPFMR